MINSALVMAAVLAIVLGVVHSWLGERRLIGPLLAPDTREGVLARSAFSRSVLRFAWHITSVAWWGMGAVLALLATMPLDAQGKLAVAAIAVTFLITGIVILITSRGRHLAWPVFVAIAGLSLAQVL